MATYCGRDYDTLISLRSLHLSYFGSIPSDRIRTDASLRFTIKLPQVIGVMTSDYSKS